MKHLEPTNSIHIQHVLLYFKDWTKLGKAQEVVFLFPPPNKQCIQNEEWVVMACTTLPLGTEVCCQQKLSSCNWKRGTSQPAFLQTHYFTFCTDQGQSPGVAAHLSTGKHQFSLCPQFCCTMKFYPSSNQEHRPEPKHVSGWWPHECIHIDKYIYPRGTEVGRERKRHVIHEMMQISKIF